ncbi:MAG: hypothetical protein R3B84_06705 [Zavarzinella sp.]
MAAGNPKQKLVDHLFSILNKNFTSQLPPQREVIDEVVYGILRENATSENADAAFNQLITQFIDWNEIRVSTVQELCDVLFMLSDVGPRAQRIISLLQEWFSLTYSYDMQDITSKGVKEGVRKIARLQAANDYLQAWITQRSLGGHALPIDESTLRPLVRLEILDSETSISQARTSMEHLIPKAKGIQFIELLTDFSHQLCSDQPACQDCPMLADCPVGQQNKKKTGESKRKKSK